MLLVITSPRKILLPFLAPFEEVTFFRTDSSKVESLSIRDSIFTVSRMATVGTEILVGIRWFHMQVSLKKAVSKVDPCVQKCDFLG